MAQNIVRMLGKCLHRKAFWCVLVVAVTFAFLVYSHSWRACAGMAVFVMLALFSVFEEYQEEPAADGPIHSPPGHHKTSIASR
jgi:hypothetical protein